MLARRSTPEGVWVIQPLLPLQPEIAVDKARLRALLDGLLTGLHVRQPLSWFDTPSALAFAGHLRGHSIVYDCIGDLPAFAMADPAPPAPEQSLLARADVVFTGRASLFTAKPAPRCTHCHDRPDG